MFNWNIDKRKIYLDHLKRGMFRKVGNQYKFNNVKFMIDELDAIRLEELSGPNVMDVRNEELFSGVERNEEESHPHVVPVDVQSVGRTKHTEAVVNFEKQFMLVCKQLSNLEAKVDANHIEMKNFITDFF